MIKTLLKLLVVGLVVKWVVDRVRGRSAVDTEPHGMPVATPGESSLGA